MKLLRLHIENFGVLQDFTLSPKEGLNILYQKNGWGKSTLAVFIKAMFYGLPATSRRSLDDNERKKYTPWQGGAFGGSIEFETSRGRFRAERFFGAKESNDTFALFDLSTNKPSDAYSAALGEELFGIDAEGFERSTYLSQRNLSGGRDNNSISAKLGDLLDDVGDIGNFDTAMSSLDKRRKYYTMTGNRGAIAEMEQEALKVQNELEHCRRVEESMREKEKALAACNAESAETKKAAEETRTRLQKAGLARERAAQMEHKNRMLAELTELSEQREKIVVFFRHIPPTPDELQENCRLYEQIKNAKARLDAIPAEPAEAEKMAHLRAKYQKGLPDAPVLERLERDNDMLRQIRARREALQDVREDDTILHRFPHGAPTAAQMDEAFEQWKVGKERSSAADSLLSDCEKNRPNQIQLIFGVILFVLGVALAGLSFLSVLSSVSMPLLIVGIAAAAVGLVFGCLWANKQAKYRHATEASIAKSEKLRNSGAQGLRAVHDLLQTYGIDAEDPSRGLAELSTLAAQYREKAQKKRRVAEELQALSERSEMLSGRLCNYFSAFFKGVTVKEDYRDELERLRREVSFLQQLEAAEALRVEKRVRTEATLADLKQQLLPFLRRYDPSGTMRAGECLDRIGEELAEYRRLCREISEKENALTRFVAEKNLGNVGDEPAVEDFHKLTQRENELQGELSELQRRQTLLKSEIDRLATDADRVPELETLGQNLKQKIDEAKANATTIAHTAKFLEEAKNALSTRYLGGMQESFCKLLSELTGEDSREAVLDTSFEVRLREGGQTRPMESFSRGWRDAVEFCMRLSLADALYREGEKPFLLLDDPFVNLDDERLAAARQLLDTLAADYQILYLVCHKERI